MAAPLTLYTAKVCPYAHRAEIALSEVGADFKRFEIDLSNKPEWYAPQVNPASKVPAIAIGGPDVPPEHPSSESTKIPESLVILELIPELYPNKSTLLPKDPILRAKARLFIENFSNTWQPVWYPFFARGEENEDKIREAIQKIVKSKSPNHKYAVSDDFTIADAAVAPFFARFELLAGANLGLANERGTKLLESLKTPEFQGFWDYFNLLKERESVKKTFWPEAILDTHKKRLAATKA